MSHNFPDHTAASLLFHSTLQGATNKTDKDPSRPRNKQSHSRRKMFWTHEAQSAETFLDQWEPGKYTATFYLMRPGEDHFQGPRLVLIYSILQTIAEPDWRSGSLRYQPRCGQQNLFQTNPGLAAESVISTRCGRRNTISRMSQTHLYFSLILQPAGHIFRYSIPSSYRHGLSFFF